MKNYETTAVFTPVLSTEAVKQAVEGYVDLLKKEGSEIVHMNFWGLKELAYPIQKKTTGIYVVIEFKGPFDIVDKLELAFRRDESVMRFLTTALDKYAVKYNEDKRNGLIGKGRKKEVAAEVTA